MARYFALLATASALMPLICDNVGEEKKSLPAFSAFLLIFSAYLRWRKFLCRHRWLTHSLSPSLCHCNDANCWIMLIKSCDYSSLIPSCLASAFLLYYIYVRSLKRKFSPHLTHRRTSFYFLKPFTTITTEAVAKSRDISSWNEWLACKLNRDEMKCLKGKI